MVPKVGFLITRNIAVIRGILAGITVTASWRRRRRQRRYILARTDDSIDNVGLVQALRVARETGFSVETNEFVLAQTEKLALWGLVDKIAVIYSILLRSK